MQKPRQTLGNDPKIGAHVSAALSLELAFDRAKEIGAQCFQIFISPPQQWTQINHTDEEIGEYLKKMGSSKIGPNFIHGTYLINLGSKSPEHLQKSISWLTYAMNMAEKLKSQGVIFHTGSHKGEGIDAVLDQIVKSLKTVLRQSKLSEKDMPPYLILETSAGQGGSIGSKFSELGKILKQVQNDRLKVCLDTQHVFASGYDIKSKQGLEDALEKFDSEIGLENLVAIHANDSKVEFASGKDRHANIGEGFIGKDGFRNLLNNKRLNKIPFILEVPGFSDSGPDRENVSILKSLNRKHID